MGLEMPQGDTVFATRTVVVSLLVGTVVTLLAGIVPGHPGDPRAADRRRPRGRHAPRGPAVARCTPVVAAGRHRRRRRACWSAGCWSTALGTAERLHEPRRRHAGAVHRRRDDLVARSCGPSPPSSAGRSPACAAPSGELARENAVRNPSRTAATAAALMIGLALVTFVSVLGTGLIGTARVGRPRADRARTTSSPRPTAGSPSPARPRGRHRRRLARGASCRSVRAGPRRASTARPQDVGGVDPATIAAVYRFSWSRGLATRRSPRSTATARSSTAASPTTTTWPSARRSRSPARPATRSTRTVTGIYDPPRLSPLLGAGADLAGGLRRAPSRAPKDLYAFVAADGAPSAAAPRRSRRRWRRSPTPTSTRSPSSPRTQRRRPVDDPQPALRAAGPVGGRQRVRHGQHAGRSRCTSAPASSGCCARSA